MKKSYKALILLAGGLVATSVFADCDDLKKYAAKSPNVTTICDQELNVLFGYDTLKKEPAWAVYELKSNLPNTFIRNRGVYGAIGNLANYEQRQSKEYYQTEFDRALLVPPANVVHNASSIVNSFRMNNVFPVDRTLWRGTFGQKLKDINQKERAIPLEKGAVVVVTGLVSAPESTNDSNQKPELMQPRYLYKIYYREQYELTKSILLPINNVTPAVDKNDLLTSIDCIEALSGHDIFYRFDDDVQADIENRKATSSSVWAVRDGKDREGVCVH